MFGKKKETAPQAPAIEEVPAVDNTPKYQASLKTVIGEGIVLEGDFDTKEPIVIKGTLKGDIISEEEVIVERSGLLQGNCNVKKITIQGEVDGDVQCRGVTHIGEGGKLSGSLSTSRLITDDGSEFDGKLEMIIAAAPESKKAE